MVRRITGSRSILEMDHRDHRQRKRK